MSVCFGLIAAVGCAIIAAIVTMALGFRDGDRPGDARVTVRALPGDGAPDGAGLGADATAGAFAEIVIENGHDSPVLVSARSSRASVLTRALVAPRTRRTAFAHRRGLGGVELLGAVDGRVIRRYLLPLASPHAATRVTVVVDQAARRTRVTTATLMASAARPLRSASARDAADA